MGWTELRDPKITEYVGDPGWDLAGDFVDRMIDLYEDVWDRPPTEAEVLESVKFVFVTTMERRYEETPPYP